MKNEAGAGTRAGFSEDADVRGVTFVLRVSEGPDAGEALVLDGIGEGRVLLGTSSVCTLTLTDPAVSRRHAALRRETRAWRIEDLQSTNGTRVNGVRVQEAFLTGGEVIAMGGTTVRLTRAGVAPDAVHTADGFGGFLSSHEATRRQFEHWERLAQTTLPLLIEGETGTGKELLAEAIHDRGPRAARPFMILECGKLLGQAAIEGALFGGEGAGQSRVGVLEQASGGTLVIDEPAELDLPAQGVLTTALDARPGNSPTRLDVRTITTTRRDLDREVQAGRFREDLLYRIAGATLEILPLRQRAGDATLLARTFWSRLGGAGDPPEDLLARYEDSAWRGNVRELQHALAERLAIGERRPERDRPARPSAPPNARCCSSTASVPISRRSRRWPRR